MKRLFTIALLFCLAATANADGLEIPSIFSAGMILQQKTNVPVWGKAVEGRVVTVTIQNKKASAPVRSGEFKVILPPLKAGGPYELKISDGTEAIAIRTVYVGEVWLASGQSNMQWALKDSLNGEEVAKGVDDPLLRLFDVPRKMADTPQFTTTATWTKAAPESVSTFSAVAYYFARDLRKRLKVPVGIINSSFGGSPAEAWFDRSALSADPYFRTTISNWNAKRVNDIFAMQKYEEQLKLHKENGAPEPSKPPTTAWSHHKPASLYNAMISPICPFAIQGVIWYQGESNAWRAYDYRRLFPMLIANWRDLWDRPEMPFYFVQIAPFKEIVPEPQDSNWAELREAQLLTWQSVPNTFMAVITDAGDPKDIHPVNKEPVGARLALAAKALVYGDEIEYSGPVYKSQEIDGQKILLTFEHTGSGLMAKDGQLSGFTIAGEGGKWTNAQAEIIGSTVAVWSEAVKSPKWVRFGWADCPVLNLYNKEGLPGTPFRTDSLPVTTQPKG